MPARSFFLNPRKLAYAMKKKQILLTNDDGIGSPGLWAAASVLAELGQVTVVAPDAAYSHFARGFNKNASGRIQRISKEVDGRQWEAFAVDGSPSQTVMHAVLEIMPVKPDLLVSGINYGENVCIDVTTSGTVGAAYEGATFGIPSLATSLQILEEEWDTFHEIDFSMAAHFTRLFAKKMLKTPLPFDVDIINMSVPVNATTKTPWRMTRLARSRYYDPYVIRHNGWESKAKLTAHRLVDDSLTADTDIYTLIKDGLVAVTPLSLDVTSRVKLDELDQLLRK